MSDDDEDVRAMFGELEGLLGDFFGGGATKGPDLRIELELDRDDLLRGKRTVRVERLIGCPGCHGSGREPAESDPCGSCDGKGKKLMQRGAFQIGTTCPDCGGSGSAKECRRCGGEARRTRAETLQVTIPPEIRDGQILRLRGKGSDNSDGKGPGDLYIAIRIPPSVVPADSPTAIPVNESGGATATPVWVGLVVAVVAIVVAALLLR